jgi:hypothetical protein
MKVGVLIMRIIFSSWSFSKFGQILDQFEKGSCCSYFETLKHVAMFHALPLSVSPSVPDASSCLPPAVLVSTDWPRSDT